MKVPLYLIVGPTLCLIASSVAFGGTGPKETPVGDKPLGIAFSIKMTGPYAQDCDLQIICAFKHKATGDNYLGAMKEFDAKVGGLLSSLRNRGEFVGEAGESILFVPPTGSIPAKRLLVIGLGDEKALSIDTLRMDGRIAAREAVRLRASRIAWAPVIRDEGNTSIGVGDGDSAFVQSVLSAYDTEIRLQAQGLAAKFTIRQWVVEAGPAYFNDAVDKVGTGIAAELMDLKQRESGAYSSLGVK